MPLYVIGLGLGDERDVTVKGAEVIKKCAKVFLESYTSILSISKERLEAAYGRPIEIAWRETVESEAHLILDPAKTSDVAFLVVGDPFGATTHTDLLMRAQDEGIETHVIHNASIMNACGACGLQLYNFGHTVSIPFFRDEWRPESFYDRIAYNSLAPWGAMHTLCLLGGLHACLKHVFELVYKARTCVLLLQISKCENLTTMRWCEDASHGSRRASCV